MLSDLTEVEIHDITSTRERQILRVEHAVSILCICAQRVH